ncbi:MAG: TlpA family protein disulfide reductase [Chloroflexi bacterium]|nr:TlpA family protein disulfide reductase [Chloroflexota bacterium]
MTIHKRPATESAHDLVRLAGLDEVAYQPARRTLVPMVVALAGLLAVVALLVGYVARPLGWPDAGGAPRAGQPAPAFALSGLDGRRVDLADYRGRPVIINFWATWCVPCRKEMPDLEAAARQHREHGLIVLAVNVQEEPERVRAFLDELRLRELLPLLDTNATVVARYQVVSLPTTYLVDRRGQLRDRHVGQLDAGDLARRLERILD